MLTEHHLQAEKIFTNKINRKKPDESPAFFVGGF